MWYIEKAIGNNRIIHKFDIKIKLCYNRHIKEFFGGLKNERLCFRLY